MQVHRMRCSRRSKGKKIFEYLVDELSTWITEDQLRISLSPMLFAELKAEHSLRPIPSIQQLRSTISSAILLLLHQARHGATILMRGNGERSGGTKTCIPRSEAKPTIP